MPEFDYMSALSVDGQIRSSAQGKVLGSFAVMPAASALSENAIVLYTGTTGTYVSGQFYMCVNTGSGYEWQTVTISGTEEDTYTADRALVTNSLGQVTASGITAAELGCLSGATSPLQAQINGKVTAVSGMGLSQNSYTTGEKNKLAGIAAGAQVNVIEAVQRNGSAVPVSGKTVNISVPVALSELTNDKGFIDSTVENLANFYTKTEVNSLVSTIPKFAVQVVSALPASGQSSTTIYLTPNSGSDGNIYDEYLWVNNAWEKIGSTQVSFTLEQDGNSIVINGTTLKDASSTSAGLMSITSYNDLQTAKSNISSLQSSYSTLNGTVSGLDTRLSTAESTLSTTVSQISIELDELNNLNLEYTTTGGQKNQDSVSLNSISGALVVKTSMPHATIKVTNALDEVVYNGAVTGRIPTGSGSMTCEISQFGKKVTKVIQVSGNTTLDLGTDGVTITLDSKWLSNGTFTINNLAVTDASFLALKNTASLTLKCVGGSWDDGTSIEWATTATFDSTKSISIPTYSTAEVITTSRNVNIPVNGTYHIVACSGGGGGGGGGGGVVTKGPVYSQGAYIAGTGGDGGAGGNVVDTQSELTAGSILDIQIGSGGSGGSKGNSVLKVNQSVGDDVRSGSGWRGDAGNSTTISGPISLSSPGGEYGSGAGYVETYANSGLKAYGSSGNGGDGGSISLLSKTYKGTGGAGGDNGAGSTGDNGTDPKVPSPFNGSSVGGKGGNCGVSQDVNRTGGTGGQGGTGLVFNGTKYGSGGNGGTGATVFSKANDYGEPTPATAGTAGTSGVVIIRRVAV